MAYETSMLFNLLAQQRARNAANAQEERTLGQGAIQSGLDLMDARRAFEDEAVSRAQQAGSVFEDAGQALPEFNPEFSPELMPRLKEAASLGSLAQVAARRKLIAQRAAEEAKYRAGLTGQMDRLKLQEQGKAERDAAAWEARKFIAQLRHNVNPHTGRPLKPSETNFYHMQSSQLGNIAGRLAGSIMPEALDQSRRLTNLSTVLMKIAEMHESDPEGAKAQYLKLQMMYPEYLQPQQGRQGIAKPALPEE